MILEKVSIPFQDKEPATLTVYVPEKAHDSVVQQRPAVLICPGGGYQNLSWREGEVVALRFLAAGFVAAVLYYSCGESALFPQSLCEAALAFAHLKENSDAYSVDPERIYTCGFSAGGHLALSLGVFWEKAWLSKLVKKDASLLRPTAQILCYPVVTGDEKYSHAGSIETLVGKGATGEKIDLVSLEGQVSEHTPPTFLWTTTTDQAVPAKNSLLLADALYEKNIPLEFHLYGWGKHGLSLSDRSVQTKVNLQKDADACHVNPHTATWFPLCLEWLEKSFGVKITKD